MSAMGERPERPVGERRRRREAEQAAAREAEAAGTTRPLTRRELRRLQAEEAARLEAIATGELPLEELQAAGEAHRAASLAAEGTGAAPSAASAGRGSATTAGSAPSAPSADPSGSPGTTTAGSAPPAASATGAATRTSTPGAPSSSAGAVDAAAVTADSAPSAASAAGATATVPTDPSARIPSRRSLRERAQDAPPIAPERPQERTATGRRPVVRTPSTAQGMRSLDATGQLTGIQPVVRPDAPGSSDPSEPTAEASVESAHTGPTALPALFEVDGPALTARAALPSPEDPAPETRSAEDEQDEDLFPMRPQWVAISSVSGATPDEAKSELPSRRSLRSRLDEEPAEAEPAPTNPAVTAVKVAVLVLVAAVLGALIWLLGSEAFDDDPSGGAAPVAAHTLITTPQPEETRAR